MDYPFRNFRSKKSIIFFYHVLVEWDSRTWTVH